jgi:Arc/MetJ-type ribon-helix-helix transcriptional regulator
MPAKKADKLKTSITLDQDLIEWVDELIAKKRFASRTHAIELALQKMRENGFGKE